MVKDKLESIRQNVDFIALLLVLLCLAQCVQCIQLNNMGDSIEKVTGNDSVSP